MPPFPESPRCLSPFQGNLFSLYCLDFQAKDRLTPRWHVGQPCGKASWESLVGKPQGKDPDPLIHVKGSVTLLLEREESARACPHSRRGLTPLGRLQKYPKIHVSTGEESSGSRTNSTQDFRPWHRWERNPKRPPSNSHVDTPFLRPPERVPEVPVVSRVHLPQLEKIQEVLPSMRDEAQFRSDVSRLIKSNLWNFQRVLHTLAATQEVPGHTRLLSRGSTRVPPTSRSPVSAS